MKLEEYIEKAKEELDQFKEGYLENHQKGVEGWPIEMEEADWGDQELATRFGLIP